MKAGVITDGQLNDAVEVHKATGSPLGRVLVELGYATQGAILSVMAQQIGIPYIDFSERKPDPTAVAIVPKDLATRYVLMPVGFDEQNRLVVAMADPQNVLALDDLRIITGYEIRPAISTKDDILAVVEDAYRVAEHVDTDAWMGGSEELSSDDLDALSEVTSEAPIVKLVNFMITKAVADRASDIHVEPQERDLRVRYRIDGVLHEMMRSPKSTQAAILSRFKVMADMDIAETRKPQDGHTALTISGHKLDFRVSTLPTVYGERVVLRILRKDSILLKLSDLGFLPQSLERFEGSFRKPYGAILVTGPTGSGKSTSLYAAINVLGLIRFAVGSLDEVTAIVQTLAFAVVTPEFTDVNLVTNGATDLFVEVFGDEVGRSTYAGIGVSSLSGNNVFEMVTVVETRTSPEGE